MFLQDAFSCVGKFLQLPSKIIGSGTTNMKNKTQMFKAVGIKSQSQIVDLMNQATAAGLGQQYKVPGRGNARYIFLKLPTQYVTQAQLDDQGITLEQYEESFTDAKTDYYCVSNDLKKCFDEDGLVRNDIKATLQT